PPTVGITAPTPGQGFAGGTITLSAQAASPNYGGSIGKVEFLVNNVLRGTAVEAPYTVAIEESNAGTYRVVARAYDNRNVVVSSSAVSFVICGSPDIRWVSPTPDQVVGAPGAFNLHVAAGTQSCPVQSVDFYENQAFLASVNEQPFAHTWTNVPVGAYTLKAIAHDVFGQTAESQIQVNVALPGFSAPAETLLGSSIHLSVASPIDGRDGTLQLFNNGQLVKSETKSGLFDRWEMDWVPPSAGVYTLMLTVTDGWGAQTSQGFKVYVIDHPYSSQPGADSVIPASYGTPAIGTLAGTFDVTGGGSANYTIPLKVVPGPNGMQPNLALEYSSQNGIGHLGTGWKISGMSAITRCPKTDAQDGVKSGINYDLDANNDTYCLDGQRLVPVRTGIYVTDPMWNGQAVVTEYRTEVESYAKIESFFWRNANQVQLTSPYRFRVTMKDGRVMDYGRRWWLLSSGWSQRSSGAESRGNSAKMWLLDRVEDRAGNFMEIDYADEAEDGQSNLMDIETDIKNQRGCGAIIGYSSATTVLPRPAGGYPSAEVWPTMIRYFAKGANAGVCGGANQQVVFKYEMIAGQGLGEKREFFYDSGAGQSSLTRRLTGIEMRSDGSGRNIASTLVRQYRLNYTQSPRTDKSLLAQVNECGADGTCLPATQFEWSSQDYNQYKHFSGPGIKGQPSLSFPFAIDEDYGRDIPIYWMKKVFVTDWNGDGKSDVLGWKADYLRMDEGDNGGDSWGTWPVYSIKLILCLATNNGFQCNETAPLLEFEGPRSRNINPDELIQFADINGDGKSDLIIYRDGASTSASGHLYGHIERICLSNGDWSCTNASGVSDVILGGNSEPVFYGDVDGDGRVDVVKASDGRRLKIFFMRENGYVASSMEGVGISNADCPAAEPNCENFWGTGTHYYSLMADVDGDGRSDFVSRRHSDNGNDQWKTCFSRWQTDGTGNWACHRGFVRADSGRMVNSVTLDFNGDGLADKVNMASVNPAKICLSTGDGAYQFTDPYIHWDATLGRWIAADGIQIDYFSPSTPRCRNWGKVSDLSGVGHIFFGDFNGDGRSDMASVATINADGNRGYGIWRICLSTGVNFSCGNWDGPWGGGVGGGTSDWEKVLVVGDFNGDGRTDILRIDRGGRGMIGYSGGAAPGKPADMVTKITTGLGAVTNIDYAPITDSSVYKKSAGASPAYREIDIQSPLFVVKQTSASNGIGGWLTTRYFYEGLRGRTDGRGLYGFGVIRRQDSTGSLTETVNYRVASQSAEGVWALMGRPVSVRQYAPLTIGQQVDLSDSNQFTGGEYLFNQSLRKISEESVQYGVRVSQTCSAGTCTGIRATEAKKAPAIREYVVVETLKRTWELNGGEFASVTTRTPIAQLDRFGNQLWSETESSDGYKKTTTQTFYNDINNWRLGFMTRASVVHYAPGLTAQTRATSFAYNQISGGSCTGPVGALCEETVEPDRESDSASGHSLWQRMRFAYDTSGNQTSATLTFRDRSGTYHNRTNTTQYDTSKRYPTRTTNALGQSQTATYHSGLGAVLTSTDANGIRVQNLYDGLGRAYGSRTYNNYSQKLSETFEGVETTGRQGYERYRIRKLSSGGGEAIVYFDELQRSVRGLTRSFSQGAYAQTATTYDSYGRIIQATAPSGSAMATTTIAYDSLGRNISESIQSGGQVLTTTTGYSAFTNTSIAGRMYSGSKVTSAQSGTGIAARSVTTYTNSQGQTVRVTDAANNNTDFVHDVFGNLTQAIGPTGITETMTYDLRGRKLVQQNPDSGYWQYRYNGNGELVEQIDARGYATQSYYDALGRAVERREYGLSIMMSAPRVTVWSYDAYAGGGSCGAGRLCETRLGTQNRSTVGGALPNPEQRQITTYDVSGRVTNTATEINGMRFTQASAYDNNSRVIANAYPSGYITYNTYNSWTGELIEVFSGQRSHWRATARNHDGGLTQAYLGNTIAQNYAYDGFGRLATAQSGYSNRLQNATFTFDALGNLTRRTDTTASLNESFGYDLLNRLASTPQGAVNYDAAGNITRRENKSYTYQSGTHRLTNMAGRQYQYDANGNVTAIIDAQLGSQTLTYGIHNLPDTIQKGGTTLSYRYNAANGRISETVVTDSGATVTWYLGNFEVKHSQDGGIEERHYLNGAEGVIGIHTRTYGQQTQDTPAGSRTRYWIKDHLGSVAAIADEQGNLVQRYRFDAWGRRTQTQINAGEIAEERGFTGHEQLVEIGLVHMNGRLYDPETGRMLQADPIIQSPYDGQNYNRYTYVLNNPLSLTDPSGFSFWSKLWKPLKMIVVAVAAYFTAGAALAYLAPATFGVSATALTAQGMLLASTISGAVSGLVGGGSLSSAAKGAIFASFFYAAGTFSESFSGVISSGVARVASHALVGCAQSVSAGGSCGSGAASAGISALVPDLGSFEHNLAARAATGAVASAVTGGKAGQGAVIAAFGYLYNDFSHRMFSPPSLPQEIVDFSAGLGDTVLLGQGGKIRDFLGIDGGIDAGSDAYGVGEWGGFALSFATGFAGGVKAAGAKGLGMEFSHFIPKRLGGPRTIFNGNFVPKEVHALSDPYRRRFMSGKWKTMNPPLSRPQQLWIRTPNVYKGSALGISYGAGGMSFSGE
ncbi:MAG TPA: hypothetical protein DEB31_10680, partial [Clostridiales bacterium]|nr:hypothetical protein [Clostridiales bacterium]